MIQYKPTIRFRCVNLHSHTIVFFFCIRYFAQLGKKKSESSFLFLGYCNFTRFSINFHITTIRLFYELSRQNKGALKYECSFKRNITPLFILTSSCKLADCTIIADDYWLILFAMNFTDFLLGVVHKLRWQEVDIYGPHT